MKYSIALTSWTVSRSISACSAMPSAPKSSGMARSRARSSPVRVRSPGITCWSSRWIIHSVSTTRRERFSAASERWSTSGATWAR